MIILQDISYIHPNKNRLFNRINLTINHHEKIALIGSNGSGKSTLLKLIARELQPFEGQLVVNAEPYFVPQIYGQFNHQTVGQALKVENKLNALREILNGEVSEENYSTLNEDWMIEERCSDALRYWQISNLDLTQKLESLSGGQKTKVFLAGILIHQPELILLDEPSNHLDTAGRELLYEFIQSTKSTLIAVSHDRKLLNLFGKVAELDKQGVTIYGGNYDFYTEQKQIKNSALNKDVLNKEKELRKAKEKEKETLERQQKLDSRGKGKQEKAGVARIMMNTMRNNAENSTSKLKGIHAEKIVGIKEELQELRLALPDLDRMKFGFDNSNLHKGKTLFKAYGINYSYNNNQLWRDNLTFQILSGERLVLKGLNGSGKTTLIKLILGTIEPEKGTIDRAHNRAIYIDQDYSLLDKELKVYEQAQQFNVSGFQEHEIKTRLKRFLFSKDDWDKSCNALSGGEKMRLVLCCLTITNQAPAMIVLDEPTNNLDIQNIEILTTAINQYHGTLIVVSHDEIFLEQIKIERSIQLL